MLKEKLSALDYIKQIKDIDNQLKDIDTEIKQAVEELSQKHEEQVKILEDEKTKLAEEKVDLASSKKKLIADNEKTVNKIKEEQKQRIKDIQTKVQTDLLNQLQNTFKEYTDIEEKSEVSIVGGDNFLETVAEN